MAVKMLRKARWGSPAAVERFLNEAELVHGLQHPGIVPIEGLGRTPGGGLFIVMEFLAGGNLEELIERRKPTIEEAARWVTEAAQALDHAHRRGIIHCDLKPGNLLLDGEGRVKVADFGLAVSLHDPASPARWAGTAGYMAPEQLDPTFGPVGPVTDVFALGLVLHRLLTGRTLFQGRRVLDALAAGGDWIGEDMEVTGPMTEVMKGCLAVDPAERFQSAAEVADRLGSLS